MTTDELRAIRLDLRVAASIDDEYVPKRIRTQQHPVEIALRLLAEVERLQLRLDVIDHLLGDAHVTFAGKPTMTIREYIDSSAPFCVRVDLHGSTNALDVGSLPPKPPRG